MSRETSVFDGIIEQKLLSLHTAFPAKVITIDGNFATPSLGLHEIKDAIIIAILD